MTANTLHPLVKGGVSILTVILVLLNPGLQGTPNPYLIWLIALGILGIIVRLQLKRIMRPLLIGVFLASILIISQGFLYRSSETYTPLFTIFELEIGGKNIGTFTLEGLIAGLIGALKIFCILISAQILVATTSIEELAYSLMKLKVPYTLSFLMATGMRFVPLVQQTWTDILDARRLRGIDIDRIGIFKKATVFYPRVIVPLVLSLFRSGLFLSIAIATRGFYIKGRKTIYYDVDMKATDYLILFIFIILFSLDVWLFIF